jgi:hypothetical protein
MTMRLAYRPARCVSVEAREKQIVASALMCAAPEFGFAASAAAGLPASEPRSEFGWRAIRVDIVTGLGFYSRIVRKANVRPGAKRTPRGWIEA